MTKQTALFENETTAVEQRSNPVQTDIKSPSLLGAIGMHMPDCKVHGPRITGTIVLDEPNRRGRTRCKVDYQVIKSWPVDLHAAAFRVVAHWFRDIGGFQTIRTPMLKHVISRLREKHNDGTPMYTEHMLHVAIHAYAHDRVEWRTKNGNAWKSIGSFFTSEEMLDQFCPQTLNSSPAKPLTDEQRDKLERQHRAQQQLIAREQADREEAFRDIAERAEKRRSMPTPRSLVEAIERLSDAHRWAFFALISKKSNTSVKRNARQRALEAIPALWRSLPDSARRLMRSQIFIECHNAKIETKGLSEDDPQLRKFQLGEVLKRLKQEYRDPKPIGEASRRAIC